MARLIEGWSDRTGEACAGRHVLAIQDTSAVKFPTTAQRRRGLGPVGKGNAYGVLVHAMVAVDAASGSCLGLVGGDVWSRDGVNPTPHRQRPLAERKSVRWVDAAQQAKSVLRFAATVTVVADREADIYPAWATVPEASFHLLGRAMSDRALAGGVTLFTAAAQFPVAGRRTIELRAHDPAHPKRTAVVELRHGEVNICRPRDGLDRSLPPTVRLRLIDVREVNPPEGVEPLHWRLLTTHETTDAAGAWQIVEWYQLRWVIEQLFRVMKSQGLRLEDGGLASADRLVKLAAAATKAACIDMQLVQERDGKDRFPASNVFSEPEVETLAMLCPTLEGTTVRQQNLKPVTSLAWAAGSSPGWAAGTATTSRPGRSQCDAAWSNYTRSIADGDWKWYRNKMSKSPSACAGNTLLSGPGTRENGSSPHARGTPGTRWARTDDPPVHPRMRGEHSSEKPLIMIADSNVKELTVGNKCS